MINKYRGGENRARSNNAVAMNRNRGHHGGGMVDMH